jgi:hypothetical protein
MFRKKHIHKSYKMHDFHHIIRAYSCPGCHKHEAQSVRGRLQRGRGTNRKKGRERERTREEEGGRGREK